MPTFDEIERMRAQGEVLQKRLQGIEQLNPRDVADELHQIFCRKVHDGRGPYVVDCMYYISNWTDKSVNSEKSKWFFQAVNLIDFVKKNRLSPESFKEILSLMAQFSRT